jgi:diguanylate cyclase (GGDEF)-like protein
VNRQPLRRPRYDPCEKCGLKVRILLPFALVSVFLLISFNYSLYQQQHASMAEEFERTLNAIQDVYETAMHNRSEKLGAGLDLIAHDAAVRDALRAKDRNALRERAGEIFKRLRNDYRITHLYFHNPDLVNILRVHEPDRFGDKINRFTAQQARRTGMPVWGAESGPAGTFVLRYVMPIHDQGKLLGFVELGEEINELMFEISEMFDLEFFIVIDKHYVSRENWETGMRLFGRSPEWALLQGSVITAQTLTNMPQDLIHLFAGDSPHGSLRHITISAKDADYHGGLIPLLDAGKGTVGSIVVLRNMTMRMHVLNKAIVDNVIKFSVVGLLLFGLFYIILQKAENKLEASRITIRDESKTRLAMQEQHIKELEHLSLYDPLTELPNRKLLHDRLAHAIEVSRREHESLAVIMLDLDRLKEINDTLGHHNGDTLLQQVAQRLLQGLRKSDTVARIGGDEFMVLLPSVDDKLAILTSNKLQQIIESPFEIDGMAINMEAAAGIALFPKHGDDASLLIRRADIAMRLAKKTKTNFVVYDSERDPYNLRRLTLFGELRYAIKHNELSLHYQPKVNIKTGELHSLEALVRWFHPKEGYIQLDEFVPLAEQTGLIHPLTHWVLEEALRQYHKWSQSGTRVRLAVNLSARNLLDTNFPDQLKNLMTKWDVDCRYLVLEITESAIMMDQERAINTLKSLSAMGTALSIDDFGTGYSSFSYLQKLPVRELKIDKSFIAQMAHNDNDFSIVHSMIDLAHDLNLTVVAEGVENHATWDLLEQLDCDVIQGFYVSRPLPADELVVWMQNSLKSDRRNEDNALVKA